MPYEFLEHTADIKLRVYGKSKAEAFEEALVAFSKYILKGKRMKLVKKKRIKISGSDGANLVYKFFEELIYLLEAESFIAGKAKISVNENELTAEITGDDMKKYSGLGEIKAATYSETYLKETSDGWELQIVLDV